MSATQPVQSDNSAPSGAKAKTPTLQQEQLIREFTETYGLDRSQIGFDSDRLDPIFDFDALSLLSLRLSDIPSISVEPSTIDSGNGIATSICTVRLADERWREVFGSCMVGEMMHDGKTVSDLKQALLVSQARALRIGLRAVGFDPVRAHRAFLTGATPKLGEEPNQHNKEMAEIHILAEEIGLIDTSGNDENYRRLMSIHFPGITSAKEMNDRQRSQWISTLRALKTSRVENNPALRASAGAAGSV